MFKWINFRNSYCVHLNKSQILELIFFYSESSINCTFTENSCGYIDTATNSESQWFVASKESPVLDIQDGNTGKIALKGSCDLVYLLSYRKHLNALILCCKI